MRRSMIALAATALIAVAACSGNAATAAPTAAPSAAPSAAAPSAAPAAPSAAPAAPTAAGGQAVAIKNFAFNPASVDAKVGETITWTNGDDAAHTVTFDDASVDSSGNINNSAAFKSTFAKAGTYAYHCKIHPSMKGTVKVS